MIFQTAPDPTILRDLVARTRYRPGWSVYLRDQQRDADFGRGESRGLTLVIKTCGYNSYHPELGQGYQVYHYFIVPAATYDQRSWRRWLFEQFLLVERHEAMEFFALDDSPTGAGLLPGEGVRPYAPHHGPGNDPYIVFEHGTQEDVATTFRGDINP